MEALLRALFDRYELKLPAELPKLLAAHWQLVEENNQRFNLTAISSQQEAAEKHYLDSLLGLALLDKAAGENGYVCDLGTGAGFPGLPLAAARPNLRFQLMDATAKKCVFLDECADRLGLNNYSAACTRAEEAARLPELRERFQVVTARAVASLPELIELSFPLLQVGGYLLAYKSSAYPQEAAAAANALAILHGELGETAAYTLPNGDTRILALIRKTAPTEDKYPRRPGMAHKRPL